ncbi:abortive infection system antitoxin AbiGi family protein [Lentzea sp. NPDC092896]|uniref:abortive infection system antitoxin AbiGi family protein n=1 Tax=Lentzea sp. NPDC092896 TaxID=3364127 RepID=UPI00381D3D46
MLGYMGHDDWQDMSDYLVHLTDGESLFKIIYEGTLRATTAQGTARSIVGLGTTQHAVCLSEIPLGLLGRLADRHGRFGVGFTRDFVRSRGGAPVWYLARGTKQEASFQALVNEKMKGAAKPDDPLWVLTPFVDNPGSGPGWSYEFEWEREWRVAGGLGFTLDDVQFLFVPEVNQEGWRDHWKTLFGARTVFAGAMIDTDWDVARLQAELKRAGLNGAS